MKYFDVMSVLSREDKKIIRTKDEKLEPNLQAFKEIIVGMLDDLQGKIPQSVGERIKKEYEYKDRAYQLGIARTKEGSEVDVLNNGYKVFGDKTTSFGVSYYDKSYNELLFLLREYVAAPSYKSSKRLYIFKIPKENILYYEEGKSKPILFPTDETNELGNRCYMVLPEYILGYFPVGEEVGDFVENPNYKNEHDYNPDGLEFEQGVLDSKAEQESKVTKSIEEDYINSHILDKKENIFKTIWNQIKLKITRNKNEALPEKVTIKRLGNLRDEIKSNFNGNLGKRTGEYIQYEKGTNEILRREKEIGGK